MKKIVSLLLCLLSVLLCFAGCGNGAEESKPSSMVTKELGLENYSKYLTFTSSGENVRTGKEEVGDKTRAYSAYDLTVEFSPVKEGYKFENVKVNISVSYGWGKNVFYIDLDENGKGTLKDVVKYETDYAGGRIEKFPYYDESVTVSSIEGKVSYEYQMPNS